MIKVFGKKIKLSHQKKRICVRMPSGMVDDVYNAMRKAHLSSRYRSRWISNAIIALQKKPEYISSVQEEWIVPGNNQIVQISLDSEAENALISMAEQIKNLNKEHPEIHSSIVRTSIIHALLHNERST